ncbi:MAG TPA: hypothetical protein VGT79_05630 [Xanthomonadaceae bacterium]|nr:hypothetical protein [Xanthomonadaceae bacterium]
MPRLATYLLCSFAFGLLAGCGSDNVPPQGAEKKEQHTELRDAIQRPINRAKAVDAEVQKAKEQQDQSIDKQVNGQAPDASSASEASGSQ